MAISTTPIRRCYCLLPTPPRQDRGRRDIREQRPQRHQRAEIGHRMHRAAHRPAECGVEHPDRNLLCTGNAVVDKAAARHRAGRSLDHLMDAHRLPSPRMPSISHLNFAKHRNTVGVLSSSSTTRSGCIRRSATEAPCSLRSNTPVRGSKRQPEPVHPTGVTPTSGEISTGIDSCRPHQRQRRRTWQCSSACA